MALSSFVRTFIPFCRSHPCHHSRTSETPLNNSICVYLILSLSLFSHSLTLTHTTNILVNFPKASLLSYSALFCFPSSLSSLNLQLSLTRVSCFTNNTSFLSLSLSISILSFCKLLFSPKRSLPFSTLCVPSFSPSLPFRRFSFCLWSQMSDSEAY